MKQLISAIVFAAAAIGISNRAEAASVIITGQAAGPTPFIAQIQLTANPPNSVKSIRFTITPKLGSVTRPVSATYPIEYLQTRGYFNGQTGAIVLPVFGLYSGFSNTVDLTYNFTDNSSQQASVAVVAPIYSDPCHYNSPTVVQPRTSSTTLSYDYMLVKGRCGSGGPVIIDTDGATRWIGTAPANDEMSRLFQNGIYLALGAVLYRIELDGTFLPLGDYSSAGVVDFHHNADLGKRGILLGVDTATQEEATVMEVDGLGNILKTWDMAAIISAAMTAAGDDPNQFVKSIHSPPQSTDDWFHNNASVYRASDDSLLVSSRENFVIALDYATGAIKWILGDTSKQWYTQFTHPNSLRHYALSLGTNTLPPIGEHAVSITSDDSLLLFDNGKNSQNHFPAGVDRTYSAPRKYHIDTQAHVATELWNYAANQSFYSPFCSSVYEDAASNYVVDYAVLGPATPSPPLTAALLGLDGSGNKIFEYRYAAEGCNQAFNTMPIHLEDVQFSILPAPTAVSRKLHLGVGTFDVPLPLTGDLGIECRSGGATGDYQIVTTFASPITITNATVTPGQGDAGTVAGAPIVSGNQVTVNLTGVTDEQRLTLNLIGVSNGTNTENVSVPMGVLTGDTTNNGAVNAGDITETKSKSGLAVDQSNFREDLTLSGSITSSDVSLTKANAGHAIPTQTTSVRAIKGR